MLKVLSKVFIFISSLCILQSCFLYGNKDSLSLSTAIKNKSDLKSTLSFINVSHNKVNIQGTGFLNITSVKLIGKSVNTELNIESKSDSEIIASISNAVTLMVGEAFNLVFTTVNAQATYEVIFALQNGAIKLNHLSSLGATTAGQILKFDGTSWGLGVFQTSQT